MNALYIVALGEAPEAPLRWIEAAAAEGFPFPVLRLEALRIP